MEKQAFEEKITELAEATKQAIIQKSMAVFDCSAFRPDDFNDDYELPTIVIYAVMDYVRFGWRPVDAKYLRLAQNLSHC